MQPTDRLHALDAVRAFALLLGLVLHASAAFLQDFPIPTWRDQPADLAAVIYYLIHMFRMSTFFLVAGFFARLLLERRGVKAFLQDRGKRIAIPLFLFGPFVMISIGLGAMLGALAHGVDYMQAQVMQGVEVMQSQVTSPPAGQTATSGAIVLIHLWFLYYLLLFYALALLLRSVMTRVDVSGRVASACDRVLALAMRGAWAPAVIALPWIAWYAQDPGWNEWLGLPAPQALIPDLDAMVCYGLAFGLGWLLHRQIPALLQLQRFWHVYLVAALALSLLCLSLIGPTPRWSGSALMGPARLLYTVGYFIGSWCWCFALIGAAVRFLSGEHPRLRYLADASYWIYLMHMAPIMLFLNLLRPYPLEWSLKLIVMVGGSLPLLLLSYHYWVRFTWIGAILNGKRQPRQPKNLLISGIKT